MVVFLHDLELGSVAPAFKESAVDGPLLLTLSEADLTQQLGLLPLQARKVLNAVNAAASPGAAPAGASAHMHGAHMSPSAPPAHTHSTPSAVAPPPASTPAPAQFAPPAAAPVMHTMPQGPHPNLLHSQRLLQSADRDLLEASQLLGSALGTRKAQTVTTAMGRNDASVLGFLVRNKQKRETNNAGDLAWSAIQAIQEAQRFTPDMPAIRMPQVSSQTSSVLQEMTRNVVFEAVRTGKASLNKSSVDTSRQDVAQALAFINGRIAASTAAPAVAVAAPPPAHHAPPATAGWGHATAAPAGPAPVAYAPPAVHHVQQLPPGAQPPPGYVFVPHAGPPPAAHHMAPPPASAAPNRGGGGNGSGLVAAAVVGGLMGRRAGARVARRR